MAKQKETAKQKKTEAAESKPEQRAWFLLATSRMAKIDPSRADNRVEVVKKRLKDTEKYRDDGELSKAEVLCLHLIALYADMTPRAEFGPLVDEEGRAMPLEQAVSFALEPTAEAADARRPR